MDGSKVRPLLGPVPVVRARVGESGAPAPHQADQRNDGWVITRFPPEPNGYLHIGHAKSICLNFGVALENAGTCNLRFDDTNPAKEDVEYVESIQADVRWLGFDWKDHLYYASDYFEQLHDYAVTLITDGKAYVCSLTPDQVRESTCGADWGSGMPRPIWLARTESIGKARSARIRLATSVSAR